MLFSQFLVGMWKKNSLLQKCSQSDTIQVLLTRSQRNIMNALHLSYILFMAALHLCPTITSLKICHSFVQVHHIARKQFCGEKIASDKQNLGQKDCVHLTHRLLGLFSPRPKNILPFTA